MGVGTSGSFLSSEGSGSGADALSLLRSGTGERVSELGPDSCAVGSEGTMDSLRDDGSEDWDIRESGVLPSRETLLRADPARTRVSPKARETEYKMPSAVSSSSLMLPAPRLA